MLKLFRSFLVTALSLSLLVAGQARAEVYPAQPIKVIVPGPPGGGLDAIARVVFEGSFEASVSFYIENLPGAGGATGSGQVANSSPDGYTILVANQDLVIHPLVKSHIPYDPIKSFVPITLVASAPEVVLVNPKLPVQTMQELLTILKANPGKYNYATPSYGTSPHIASDRLFRLSNMLDVVHVPFTGAPPAITATIAGDTQILHITLPLVAPHIRSGALRALAVAAPSRVAAFPEIPTLTESGIPDHDVGFWVGVMAPMGTDQAKVNWLRQRIGKALSDHNVRARLEAMNFNVIASTPDEFKRHLEAEGQKWGRLVEQTQIKVSQ
jgi:tripartite-type tricarboxylate transporter receptor subunit TctC